MDEQFIPKICIIFLMIFVSKMSLRYSVELIMNTVNRRFSMFHSYPIKVLRVAHSDKSVL